MPLTVSCFSKIQIGFAFLVPAHPGSPGKRAVKCVCVCACTCTCVRACVCSFLSICHTKLVSLSWPLPADCDGIYCGAMPHAGSGALCALDLIFDFNAAFSFLCLFCVVVHFFWLVNACFCCFRFSFFHTKPRDWLAETPEWPILCWEGCETTTLCVAASPRHCSLRVYSVGD